MSKLKIRWKLLHMGDINEPTARFRAFNVWPSLSNLYDVGEYSKDEKCDIVILQYYISSIPKNCEIVVADINDFILLEDHKHRGSLLSNIDNITAFSTSSERLQQHLSKFDKFVYVIEDCIDEVYFSVPRKKRKNRKEIEMLWFGMHDNIMYFDTIDYVLEKLSKKYDFVVNFVTSRLDGRGKSNEKKVASKKYKTRFVEWSIDNLVNMLSTADIGIIPAHNNEWCMCKSYNKLLTFMAAGIPTVAFPIYSYLKVGVDWSNCVFAYEPREWYKALSILMKNSFIRNAISDRALLDARKYGTDYVVNKWVDFIERIRPV